MLGHVIGNDQVPHMNGIIRSKKESNLHRALVYKLTYSCVGFFLSHFYKGKTTRTSRHTIRNEVYIFDNAMRGKEVLQTQFRGIEGKISDEKFVVHDDYCLD